MAEHEEEEEETKPAPVKDKLLEPPKPKSGAKSPQKSGLRKPKAVKLDTPDDEVVAKAGSKTSQPGEAKQQLAPDETVVGESKSIGSEYNVPQSGVRCSLSVIVPVMFVVESYRNP